MTLLTHIIPWLLHEIPAVWGSVLVNFYVSHISSHPQNLGLDEKCGSPCIPSFKPV